MKKVILFLLFMFPSLVFAQINEPLIKELTTTGAVSTDNKASVLYYVYYISGTAGDVMTISDGATNKITMITEDPNRPIIYDPKVYPLFRTDIAATLTGSGSYATFIYEERQA